MRFLFILVTLTGSIAMAEVSNFNELVKETTLQERRLHKKLLHALQGTQVAVAYNDRWEQISEKDLGGSELMEVRLVKKQTK